MDKKRKRFVISVGGSLIVPNGGINIKFLSDLNKFIRTKVKIYPNWQFFLVIGGGEIARHYRDAGRKVLGKKLTFDDLDWLGIHSTHLNAHLVRTIFRNIAHPKIIINYDTILKANEPVVVAAGWKPGWSTDYDAVLLCEDYEVDSLINLSNIDGIYDKDPNKFNKAKRFSKIKWKKFRLLLGEKWIPGSHMPFDPIAAKKAEELKLKLIVLKGDDFLNLERYFSGKKFIGTIVD